MSGPTTRKAEITITAIDPAPAIPKDIKSTIRLQGITVVIMTVGKKIAAQGTMAVLITVATIGGIVAARITVAIIPGIVAARIIVAIIPGIVAARIIIHHAATIIPGLFMVDVVSPSQ